MSMETPGALRVAMKFLASESTIRATIGFGGGAWAPLVAEAARTRSAVEKARCSPVAGFTYLRISVAATIAAPLTAVAMSAVLRLSQLFCGT